MRDLALRARHRRGDRTAHLFEVEALRRGGTGHCPGCGTLDISVEDRAARPAAAEPGERDPTFARQPARGGDALARPAAAGGSIRGGAAGAGAVGAAGTSRTFTAAAGWAPAISASGVPTGTVVPGSTSQRSMTPSSKMSISMAPFWVSTTATTSPRLTRSPGRFSHSTNVPASISAPSDGMRNSPISRPMSLSPPQRSPPAVVTPPPRDGVGRGSAPRRCTRDRRVHRAPRKPPP